MMDTGDLDRVISARVHSLRVAAGLSIEALAKRSGVSRSMISLIERAESSPTANVLDRLAEALGVTLASLFVHADPAGDDPDPVARRAEQRSWTDPQTGYRRRNLSPAAVFSPLELVEVVLPPGAAVHFDAVGRAMPVHEQIWVLEGEVEFRWGEARFQLSPGDCLALRLDRPTAFANAGRVPARYLVALARGEFTGSRLAPRAAAAAVPRRSAHRDRPPEPRRKPQGENPTP